ncbi:condensin complex non-SMC subunit Cnd1 [Entomophthora muscae]|uniref:Condensin complex non-SMC subunit Cnd1 n=1 Tax=Entomophthora muscae TaxID=34485 RepID=A0ACC2TFX9_9FUNG|nr:condensin complex non-SMC subunit Cnd1 [Entomophthora muscae]
MDISFNLTDVLVAFQDNELRFSHEISPTSMSQLELDKMIKSSTDSLSYSPQGITSPELFDSLTCLLRDMACLSPKIMNRLYDVVISGFKRLISHLEEDIEQGKHPYDSYCAPINMYTFLVYVLINNAEAQRKVEKSQNKATKSKGVKALPKNESLIWDWPSHQPRLFEVIYKVLSLPLRRVFPSNQDIETLTGTLVKSMFSILLSPENLKTPATRTKANHIISICVKRYGHAFSVQTTVSQNLQYYEHLCDPMAELLDLLASEYDYPNLAGEVIREISQKDFSATDKIGPKSFSSFLVRLCELSPKLINKHMGILVKHLDSEAYSIRCGMIEILGILILDLVSSDPSDATHTQIGRYFDILEERFKDVNYLVRSRVLQVCGKIAEAKAKFPKRRPRLIFLTAGRLKDKSFAVRKNAIKTLTKFLRTHPFVIDGGSLSYELLEEKHAAIMAQLEEFQKQHHAGTMPDEINPEAKPNEPNGDSMEETDANGFGGQMDGRDASAYVQLQLKEAYYKDALYFIDQLKSSLSSLSQLLQSTNKSEAIEAMDFFVEAHTYKIKEASEGIKSMIHLVWSKDNAEEGKGVQSHLKDCFYNLYLTAPTAKDAKERINQVARNLISLALNASLADLTSLEELIRLLTKDRRINASIIEKLWGIYGHSNPDIPYSQRRGAIMILSMVGKADHGLITDKLDLLMRIGLGDLGRADFELAKYTCLALQCIGGSHAQKIKGTIAVTRRLPINEALFGLLGESILQPDDKATWFGMAEQAINTIFELALRPDTLCSGILRRKAHTFMASEQAEVSDPWCLTQLMFIAGHAAIKQIVYLEVVEAQQKQMKSNKADQSEGDLDNVGASSEDIVAENMRRLREDELLGEGSLLKVFADMAVNICSNSNDYQDKTLQIITTLSLAKFMCVSAAFCDRHLPLLLTILEKSKEPIIRSNIVISLGDVTACFNTLIGENMEYMYNRLKDSDDSVKKNALMVLTHLVLNGMIKVKGQLAEMAKCLVDPDTRISDLAKLFFTEYASKDNAVYNNLPDIISNLSLPSEDGAALGKEEFRKIMKFLFEFIKDKERQCENFVEKLCQRFRLLENGRQAQDIGYCLTLMPYKSDKTFRKLAEGIKYYQIQLADKIFFGYMEDIISKARQQVWQRVDNKAVIDDFEAAIKKIHHKDDPNYQSGDEEDNNSQEENELENSFVEEDVDLME